jgi:drug/metabolite transporter (DMT)-like permease
MAAPEPLAAALALVVNAFVWGVSWWPFRELQAHGMHPLWSTAAVYLVSLGVLLAVRPRALRGATAHPQLLVLLAASGTTNVGFNWAVTEGDVVRVVLLFYLMPAWSTLLAWPLLGERPTGPALLRLVLALAGVVVILKTPQTPWPVPQSLPDVLAIAGGLAFALTNIMLRRVRAVPAVTRVGVMFAGGALAAVLTGLVAGAPAPVRLPADAWGVAIALSLGFLLANVALQYGASRLPAQTTSLVMLSEVVFASVTSVLAGASEPTANIWLGGAMVLAAAAWAAIAQPGKGDTGRTQSSA